MSAKSRRNAKARRKASRAERFAREAKDAEALRRHTAECNSVQSRAKARRDKAVLGARTDAQRGWHSCPREGTEVLRGNAADSLHPCKVAQAYLRKGEVRVRLLGRFPQQGKGWSERDLRRADSVCESHNPTRTKYRPEKRAMIARKVEDRAPIYGTVDPGNKGSSQYRARVHEALGAAANGSTVNPAEYKARPDEGVRAYEKAEYFKRKQAE